MLDHAAHAFAVSAKGRDERGQHDHARFHEEFGHFADAADVLHTVFAREAQVAAQSVTDVVAVQHEGAATLPVQGLFNGMGQRGFARAGQSGEPDNRAAMAVLRFTPCAGDGGVMPDDVLVRGWFQDSGGKGLEAFNPDSSLVKNPFALTIRQAHGWARQTKLQFNKAKRVSLLFDPGYNIDEHVRRHICRLQRFQE